MAHAIYLDHHATTPVDPRVVEAMVPCFTEGFGNPSSLHACGRVARRAIEAARDAVAAAVGASAEEVTFTPSATTANNLALWGAVEGLLATDTARRALVVSAIEHKSVIEPARAVAARYGLELRLVPVDGWGRVKKAALAAASRDALLVSVQLANNEVGTIQDVAAIAAIARSAGALYHCDATQGIGRTPFSMREVGADLVTFAAHKLYGPKGAATLVARSGLSITPRCQGGPQEAGVWPGTENVPAIVGFGRAVTLSVAERESDATRLADLRMRLLSRLAARVEVGVVGAFLQPEVDRAEWPGRLAGNLSLLLPEGVTGSALVEQLADQVCLSTGAACGCAGTPSTDVLRALGFPDSVGARVVRVSPGRFTTPGEIDRAADLMAEAIRTLLRPA